ncbi:MAG: uracil-DNA glycosylase [Conexivisphaerales archaeon]
MDIELQKLENDIVTCTLCPRLVSFREGVKPKAKFRDQAYWRKPVPGFGDPNAWLLIIGLAPAAHGGNRTGRVFTGDESGNFLIHALYKTGFANQPYSISKNDGLKLKGCYLTAAVKCVPPENKPTRTEELNCKIFLERELCLLHRVKAVLTLGGFAFEAYLRLVKNKSLVEQKYEFHHGVSYKMPGMPTLYASYHPTPRNTHTGTLTQKMLIDLLNRIKKENIPE